MCDGGQLAPFVHEARAAAAQSRLAGPVYYGESLVGRVADTSVSILGKTFTRNQFDGKLYDLDRVVGHTELTGSLRLTSLGKYTQIKPRIVDLELKYPID